MIVAAGVLGVVLLSVITYLANDKGRTKNNRGDARVLSNVADTSPARAQEKKPSVTELDSTAPKVGFQHSSTAAPKRIPPAGPARLATRVRGVSWSVEDDQLVKEGLGFGCWVEFGDQGWTDYDLTFEASKRAGPGNWGVNFRHSEGKCYVLIPGNHGNNHTLGLWSSLGNSPGDMGSKPGTIQPLEWYKLKISLRGPRIRIELDDHLLFDCTDEFSQKGDVALKCYNSAARFRNIKVTAPDGSVLWEGPPDLPKE